MLDNPDLSVTLPSHYTHTTVVDCNTPFSLHAYNSGGL